MSMDKIKRAKELGYIKIKPWKEIKKTLDKNGYCDCIWFNEETMMKFCDHILKVNLDDFYDCKEYVCTEYRFCDFKYCSDDSSWTWAPQWFEPYDKELNSVIVDNIISINIDLSKPDEARKILENAIKKYENRFDWTAHEIEQAREFLHNLVLACFDNSIYPVFYAIADSNKVEVVMNSGTEDNLSSAQLCDKFNYSYYSTSSPRGKDVFNPIIGKCVALCRATNTPIPDFILNKNKYKE